MGGGFLHSRVDLPATSVTGAGWEGLTHRDCSSREGRTKEGTLMPRERPGPRPGLLPPRQDLNGKEGAPTRMWFMVPTVPGEIPPTVRVRGVDGPVVVT